MYLHSLAVGCLIEISKKWRLDLKTPTKKYQCFVFLCGENFQVAPTLNSEGLMEDESFWPLYTQATPEDPKILDVAPEGKIFLMRWCQRLTLLDLKMISTFQHLLFCSSSLLGIGLDSLLGPTLKPFSLLAWEAKTKHLNKQKTKPFSINITWYGKYVRWAAPQSKKVLMLLVQPEPQLELKRWRVQKR